MQCKDIPDRPILEFLARHRGTWCCWHEPNRHMPTVRDAMPPGLPDKLILAKMKMLMRRGLVDGCDCGCRGDFEITAKGLALLGDDAPDAEPWEPSPGPGACRVQVGGPWSPVKSVEFRPSPPDWLDDLGRAGPPPAIGRYRLADALRR